MDWPIWLSLAIIWLFVIFLIVRWKDFDPYDDD